MAKLNPARGGARNEESRGDGECERPIVIPLVARVVPIGVDQLTVIVAVGVEHVRVAVGVCGVLSISLHP